jgi:hypothetical protein
MTKYYQPSTIQPTHKATAGRQPLTINHPAYAQGYGWQASINHQPSSLRTRLRLAGKYQPSTINYQHIDISTNQSIIRLYFVNKNYYIQTNKEEFNDKNLSGNK